jgi:hypothetical protein
LARVVKQEDSQFKCGRGKDKPEMKREKFEISNLQFEILECGKFARTRLQI